jgi:hypothetical protein
MKYGKRVSVYVLVSKKYLCIPIFQRIQVIDLLYLTNKPVYNPSRMQQQSLFNCHRDVRNESHVYLIVTLILDSHVTLIVFGILESHVTLIVFGTLESHVTLFSGHWKAMSLLFSSGH